jgi:hypothetical protein
MIYHIFFRDLKMRHGKWDPDTTNCGLPFLLSIEQHQTLEQHNTISLKKPQPKESNNNIKLHDDPNPETEDHP